MLKGQSAEEMSGARITAAHIPAEQDHAKTASHLEPRLRDSEDCFQLTQRVLAIGTWDWDLVGKAKCSEQLFRLYGISGQNRGLSFEEWSGCVHPDDQEGVKAQIMAHIDNPEPFDRQFRIVLPDGSVRWIHGMAKTIFDDAGRPQRMIGVDIDISRYKTAEDALRESEERFRIAVESSGQALYEMDLRTEVINVFGKPDSNIYLENSTPKKLSEYLQRIHPDDRDRVCTAIRKHVKTGAPFSGEYRVIINGVLRYRTSQMSFIRDKYGQPLKLIGVVKDVTEERMSEQANAELAAIVQSAETAIIHKDLSGKVMSWNAGAERIYGYSAPEMIGRNILVLVPSEYEGEETAILEKASRGEPVAHLEAVRRKKSGEAITVLLTISPVRDRNGAVIGAAHIAWDITQLKELQRQLAQAQKLESIGQLAAGIAHEINTPIQYIGDNAKFLEEAFGDLLRSVDTYRHIDGEESTLACRNAASEVDVDYLKTEIPSALEQLLEGVDHVARIVRAMKEFSYPGPVDKAPVDINRAIESTVLVSKNEWKYVAELTTDLDPELPPVPCIAGEFNQVILNLIVNAAHAIADVVERSGKRGYIRISTRSHREFAEIRVTDSGIGIPEAIQSRLFDPFFTTKPVGKGTGQGLAIAHAVIVQKHRGTIHFESAPGGGTTFVVRLPFESEGA